MQCQGEGVLYWRLDQVIPEQLEPRLQKWLGEQAGQHPVKWHHISVVFSHLREQEPAATSMLLHWDGSRQLGQLAPEWRPHGHLLFVDYRSELQQLRVYGGLSLAEYQQALAESGFLTLGELQPTLELGEDKELEAKKALQPYYDLDEAAEYSAEELALATDWLCTQVLGLQQAGQSDAEFLEAELAALLRNDAQNALGFEGATFLAACHRRFCAAFVARERRLLRYRLGVHYRSEQERLYFAQRWFPGVLEVELNQHSRFLGYADGTYLVRSLRDSDRQQAQRKHSRLQEFAERLHPGQPALGVYFGGDVQHLPEALQWDLPVSAGKVYFGHHELPAYLEHYLEWTLVQRIELLKLTLSAHLAPTWSRVEHRVGSNRFRRSHVERLLKEKHAPEREMLLRVLWERLQLEQGCPVTAEFVADYALPFVAQLDGRCGDYEGEPLLMPQQQPTAQGSPVWSGEVPQTYAELCAYASAHWPPCMAALVHGCRGAAHLRYTARLKVAAFLRRCGFDEAQSKVLWCALFSETDVYAAATEHGRDFLASEHGSVLVYDYKTNRQERLGASCKSVADAGLCPIGERLRTPDIEECQRGCLARFNEVHGSALQYPIRSPENYFQLSARRS